MPALQLLMVALAITSALNGCATAVTAVPVAQPFRPAVSDAVPVAQAFRPAGTVAAVPVAQTFRPAMSDAVPVAPAFTIRGAIEDFEFGIQNSGHAFLIPNSKFL